MCQHCRTKYSLDSSGIDSKKTDDLLEAGIVAYKNEDYRNAASFFKNAIEINPKNGQAYHYYNLSSDLFFLQKGGIKNAPILIKSLKGKMGTIIDMYYSISDDDIRKELLSTLIDDFDML